MHRYVPFFALVLFCLLSNPVASANENPQADVVTYLVSSPHLDDVKLAAKIIYNGGVHDEQVLDVVAQRLAMLLEAGVADSSVDTIAWVAKALGETGNARYRRVIENSVWLDRNADHISRHVSSALKNLRGKEAQQFEPEDIHWPGDLRTRATAGRIAGSPTAEQVAAIAPDTVLADVYAALGTPTSVMVSLPRSSMFRQPVRAQNLQLVYTAGGVVKMRSSGDKWLVDASIPRRDDSSLARDLASEDPETYASAAAYMLDVGYFPASLTGIAEATILRELKGFRVADPVAVELLCDVLAFSGNAANRNALIRIANATRDKKFEIAIREALFSRGYR